MSKMFWKGDVMSLQKRGNQFSPRSAPSLQREGELQKAVNFFQEAKASAERDLNGWRNEKQKRLQAVAGHQASGESLGEILRKIDDAERMVATYEQSLKDTQEKLAAFQREVSDMAGQRQANQEGSAKLTRERIKKVGTIQQALQSVRHLVQEYQGLTAQMEEKAEALEMEIRDWDSSRFSALLQSLPADLLLESERWAASFLGQPDGVGVKAYVVIDETAKLPESLAQCGLARFGDVVYLSDAAARELLRDDVLNPHYTGNGDGILKYVKQRLMLKDEFDVLAAEAEKTGVSVEHAIFMRGYERSRQRMAPPVTPKQKESRPLESFWF